MTKRFRSLFTVIASVLALFWLSGCTFQMTGSATASSAKKSEPAPDEATDGDGDDAEATDGDNGEATDGDDAETPAVKAPDKAVKKSGLKRAGRPGETGSGGDAAQEDDASSEGEATSGDEGEAPSALESAKQKAEEILESYQNQ
ncbi:MAG: hypothetical protein GX146_04585 [Myxococcales bacterium]|jgi:hypothetical protein|nr:hypothetical protein [Myxococcales bacterium]